jgi:hypothetical protein
MSWDDRNSSGLDASLEAFSAKVEPAPYPARFETIVENSPMSTDKIEVLPPADLLVPLKRHSRLRLGLAFAAAAVSDVLSFWTVIAPPAQWALDVGTAFILFLILGKRWALLPGLIAEAIPGMGVFPVWVLVVASIAVYDGVKKPSRNQVAP